MRNKYGKVGRSRNCFNIKRGLCFECRTPPSEQQEESWGAVHNSGIVKCFELQMFKLKWLLVVNNLLCLPPNHSGRRNLW